MKKLAFAVALALAAPAFAQDEAETFPSPGEIVDAAKSGEWIAIPPEDLLVRPQRLHRDDAIGAGLRPRPCGAYWTDRDGRSDGGGGRL